MITTSETKSVFTIRDFPLFRLLGAAACFISSLPLGILMIVKLPFPPPAKYYGLIAIVLYFFCLSIWLVATAKVITTKVDRSVQTISVATRSLFTSSFKSYNFSEVAKSFGGLRVNTDYRQKRSGRNRTEYKVYAIQLPLATGDDLDLSGYAWFHLNGCKLAVERANQYINGSG